MLGLGRPASSLRLHRPVQQDPTLPCRRSALLVVLPRGCLLGADQEMTQVLKQASEVVRTCKKTRSWSEKALNKTRVLPPVSSRLQSLKPSMAQSTEEDSPLRVRPRERRQRVFPSSRRTVIQSQDWGPAIKRTLSSARRVLGQMKSVIRVLRQL